MAASPLSRTRRFVAEIRRTVLQEVLRRPVLVLWCLFVGLEPFYVIPSGLPQPGDVLILVLVPMTFLTWDGKIHPNVARSIRTLAVFTIWVWIVNLAWAALEGKWTVMKAYTQFPIYYTFNFAIFMAALVLFQRYGTLFLKATVGILLVDLVVQIIASIAFGIGKDRSAVFFNNANQLGYWALLTATIVAFAQRRLGMSRLAATLALVGCAYLAMISASRAAVAGIGILFILLVFANPRVIILGSLIAVGLVTIGGPITQAIEKVEERANQKSRRGFAEERAYDRLWNFKEYAVVGAGEGDFSRFTENGERGLEIHSSFGTVLFCYGIPGLLMFLVFLGRVMELSGFRASLMLIPTFAHAFSHQGLRFTMLWVMFAMFVALKQPLGPATPPTLARR